MLKIMRIVKILHLCRVIHINNTGCNSFANGIFDGNFICGIRRIKQTINLFTE